MFNTGFVSLVGAGPGDPELITVKALQRLRAADVVVYDALVAPELLNECRPDASLIDVGKRAGRHSYDQTAINTLLIDHARAGQQVVRLKGGDPFVFGRGGEEVLALTAAGVAWDVVPGVSAALAVPAAAGIPVTHRGIGRSLAIVTGHTARDGGLPHLDWRALATGVDTLVVLMGVGHLAALAQRLIDAGRPATTPTAIIQWGTTAQQTTVVATLQTIANEATRAAIGAPATLVIGEVVGLRTQLELATLAGLVLERA